MTPAAAVTLGDAEAVLEGHERAVGRAGRPELGQRGHVLQQAPVRPARAIRTPR
jgi:hypothetical protein